MPETQTDSRADGAAPAVPPPSFDALIPPEIARKASDLGERKASMSAFTTFVLSVLAGAFIALGAMFATTVQAGAAGSISFGVTRLPRSTRT